LLPQLAKKQSAAAESAKRSVFFIIYIRSNKF
jgi:hypothetical protein